MRRVPWLIGIAVLTAALAATVRVSAAADVEAGRQTSTPCARCHGQDGNSTIPGIPSLAGQPTMFTHWQLIKFKDGRRKKDAQALPLMMNLSDADMADLAAYFAAQRPTPRPASTDPAKASVGRRLVEQHHCVSCHRGLAGQQQVPRLAGQDLTYLLRMLRGFKAQTAADLDGMMTMSAQPLTDADIENLAHYIADLPPAPPQ